MQRQRLADSTVNVDRISISMKVRYQIGLFPNRKKISRKCHFGGLRNRHVDLGTSL